MCILRGMETTSGLQQMHLNSLSECVLQIKQSKRSRIETNAEAFGLTAGQTAAAAQSRISQQMSRRIRNCVGVGESGFAIVWNFGKVIFEWWPYSLCETDIEFSLQECLCHHEY